MIVPQYVFLKHNMDVEVGLSILSMNNLNEILLLTEMKSCSQTFAQAFAHWNGVV